MRKLKLQVQMTVDGYMAGPNGEMDFMVWDWDEALKEYVNALTEPVDTIVLGRKLAEGFIPYWASVAADSNNPEQAAGKKYTETPKVVFTKTLDQSLWENTTLAKGDLSQEIEKLKTADGKDMIAYGGAAFVSSLLDQQLVDEIHLFINPKAIGHGLPVFKPAEGGQNLTLVNTTPFACGIVALQYAPAKKG